MDRTRKEFSDDDIAKIAGVYHAWREGKGYEDVPGFCKSAKLEEIEGHGHVLTPGRYVGAADVEDDEVPFAERFARVASRTWRQQFAGADTRRYHSRRLARVGCRWIISRNSRVTVADLLDGPFETALRKRLWRAVVVQPGRLSRIRGLAQSK